MPHLFLPTLSLSESKMTQAKHVANGDQGVPKLVFHAEARIRLLMLKEVDVYWLHPAEQLLLAGFWTWLKELLRSMDIKRSAGNRREPCEEPRSPFPVPF